MRASEAAEDTESSSSCSSDSSDKPAAEEEKPETRASEAQNLDVVPREEEEAPVSSVVPREEEKANEEDDEEGARAAAMKRFNENFVEALKPLGTNVLNDKRCTSRTISGLLSTLMTVLCEPSELDTKALKALQSLGELNRETKHSLKAGLKRNSQFQAYLRATEERLKQEREDYEKAYDVKLKWIRTKVTELTAEKNETEKGLDYRRDIEEFVVRAFELLKKAQESDDASLFQWRGLKCDLSRKGVEELTKPTLAEGILMDILRTAETGTTVVQEVETKMVDFDKKAKPAMIIDYEEDEKEVPSSHQREKKEEKEDACRPLRITVYLWAKRIGKTMGFLLLEPFLGRTRILRLEKFPLLART